MIIIIIIVIIIIIIIIIIIVIIIIKYIFLAFSTWKANITWMKICLLNNTLI